MASRIKKTELEASDAKSVEEAVRELAKLRDRTGKKQLPLEERLQLLNEIYDGALYFLKQSLIVGRMRGTAAIMMVLQGARLEQTELQRCYGVTADSGVHISYDLDLPVLPGKAAPSIEA